MKNQIFIFMLMLLVYASNCLFADEIFLKNGDRLTGTIVSEDDESIVIETSGAGTVTIQRSAIDKVARNGGIEKVDADKPKTRTWKGELSAGLDQASGNTDKTQFSGRIDAVRKVEDKELAIRADGHYSTTRDVMDSQKWYFSSRFAKNIWNSKWTNFYKIEADHDKFSGIHYRLVPSTGIAYAFADTPEWKAIAETAIGYDRTVYNTGAPDKSDPVMIMRIFLDRTFEKGTRFTEDFTIYPSLDERGEYRIRSETALTNPLMKGLALRVSFVLDYNSDPPEGREETDRRLITSIVYSF